MTRKRAYQGFQNEQPGGALPVLDSNDVLLGIVTIDDILWVASEEFSEDMQKIGGRQKPSMSPTSISVLARLIKKRVGWLTVLFPQRNAHHHGHAIFQRGDWERSLVLGKIFIPLTISAGGNSGSQASTLIIRAMALGEIGLGDWWRYTEAREILSCGLTLGLVLGAVRFFLRIEGMAGPAHFQLWHSPYPDRGYHFHFPDQGIVLWGNSVIGSMLPILLKRAGIGSRYLIRLAFVYYPGGRDRDHYLLFGSLHDVTWDLIVGYYSYCLSAPIAWACAATRNTGCVRPLGASTAADDPQRRKDHAGSEMDRHFPLATLLERQRKISFLPMEPGAGCSPTRFIISPAKIPIPARRPIACNVKPCPRTDRCPLQ